MAKIIQFSHPGKDLTYKQKTSDAYIFTAEDEGYRFWNNEADHKRKFIRSKGQYLEKKGSTSFETEPKKGIINFWGEWEPQSKFTLTGTDDKELPPAIHEPLYSDYGKGCHNTDPFVFGDCFYYTNCKQYQEGNGKKMLSLDEYSIILYGSEIDRSKFVLDTLFVIESKETVLEYRKHKNDYPELLKKATIELGDGLQPWHTLYKAKMYKKSKYEKNPYIFSFVPCVPNYSDGFKRPVIDTEKYNLQSPGAGTVLYGTEPENCGFKTIEAFWNSIVKDVIKQGCSLGIKIEMPEIMNSREAKKLFDV